MFRLRVVSLWHSPSSKTRKRNKVNVMLCKETHEEKEMAAREALLA